MKPVLRPAEWNDAPALTNLSGQLGYETSLEEVQNRLEMLLPLPDHRVEVALVEGKIAGWIHSFFALRLESEPFVEIGGMVVDERFRRMGIGRMLVNSAREWAKSKPCNKVRVRSNIIRQDARRFYEHLGFRETKTQAVFDLKLKS